MDKKAIIQELRDWNNAVLFAQARSFLEPFGLTIRFDADVFDENERHQNVWSGRTVRGTTGPVRTERRCSSRVILE